MTAAKSLVRIVGAGVFIAVAGAAGFQLSDIALNAATETEEGPRGPQGATRVQVSPVTMQTFVDAVQAVGTTRARRAVDLRPPTSGQISEVLFETGQRVAEGDVVLRLHDAAERATLKAAEASLSEAQMAFERQSQLTNSGATTQASFEAARAALMRAEAEVDLARAALEDHILRAPFAGVTGLSDLSPGAYIEASTVVTTLDDLAVIEVAFSVPERVLSRLSEGQVVHFTSSAYPGREFTGALTAIDTRVDQTTRALALRAEVPNADGALVGGMFMQVSLVMNEHDALSVPERALTLSDGKTLIHLAENGQVLSIPVETGALIEGQVEITSGSQGGVSEALKPGAQVIVSNLQSIESGDEIVIAGQEQATLTSSASAVVSVEDIQ